MTTRRSRRAPSPIPLTLAVLLALFGGPTETSAAPRQYWVEATFAEDSFVTRAVVGDRYLLVVTVDDEAPPIDAGNAQIFPGTSDLYLNERLAYDDVEGSILQFDFGLVQFKAVTGPGLTFIPFVWEDPAAILPQGPTVLADRTVLGAYNVVTDENDGEGRRTAFVGRAPRPDIVFRYSIDADDLVDWPTVHDASGARNEAVASDGVEVVEVLERPARARSDSGTHAFIVAGGNGLTTSGSRLLTSDKVAAAGGFTVEAWVRWTGGDDAPGDIVAAGATRLFVAGRAGAPGVPARNAALSLGDGPGPFVIGELSAAAWHHVAAVFVAHGGPPDERGVVTGDVLTLLDGEVTGAFEDVLKSPAGDDGPITLGMPAALTAAIFDPRISLRVLDPAELLIQRVLPPPSYAVDVAPSANGAAGATVDLVARLMMRPGDLASGASAWSLGLRTEGGARIASAELPAAFAGLSEAGGFAMREVAADGRSVTSAVVLSLRDATLLPLGRDTELLRVDVSATIPLARCEDAVLRFVDGLRGSGDAVRNQIVDADGREIRPALGSASITLCATEPDLTLDRSPIDFGAVVAGGGASRRVVTIVNRGSVERRVLGVALAAGSSPDFSVSTSVPSGIVPPAGELEVRITYRPGGAGTDVGTVRITTDDPALPGPVDIAVRGRGVTEALPEIAIEPESRSIDFGLVDAGDDATRPVTIRNVGAAPLGITAIRFAAGSSPRFTLVDAPANATLAPNDALALSVRFAPTGAGAVTGTLEILSEDPSTPRVAVTLRGTGESATPSFRRGDPDDSGAGNITDAIVVLSYLFSGGDEPRCVEAAETNGDGRLDIADPIYHLTYLFLGGPPPTAPGPTTCGEDPTPATSLGCSGYSRC